MIPPLFAVFAWPAIMIVLFARLKPAAAVAWSLLGAYLLLPGNRGVDLPFVPILDKQSVPALVAFLAAALVVMRSPADAQPTVLPGWIPRPAAVRLCLVGLVLGIIGTTLTNGDVLIFGATILSGMRPYDAGSVLLDMALTLLPLLLARRFLGHPQAHKTLLLAIVVGGLAYSLLALFEVRMSPQINSKIYGFFPHKWNQHVRGDGYRPIVFLAHGLLLSLFLSTAVLASLALFRGHEEKVRAKFLMAALWLFATLVLSKSLGALMITALLAPAILLLSARVQLTVAAVIAMIVLTYPMLRGADLVPVDRVMSLATSIDPGRASSLQHRLNNEDQLLERANQRPLFGWGTYGRNRVFNEHGQNLSTTDGRWVILAGTYGWVGYLSQFGLLTLGILLLWWRSKHYEVTLATAGLAIVLTGNLLDVIPNSSVTPITWMMAGALIGRVELGRIADKTAPEPAPQKTGGRYSRFGGSAPPAPPPEGQSGQVYTRETRVIHRRRTGPAQ